MKERFNFEFSEEYLRNAKKLIKSKRLSLDTLNDALEKLSENPLDSSLKSHKVSSKNYGKAWSSRIDGDIRIIWQLRIIWQYSNKKIEIFVLDIGGHSGFKRVY